MLIRLTQSENKRVYFYNPAYIVWMKESDVVAGGATIYFAGDDVAMHYDESPSDVFAAVERWHIASAERIVDAIDRKAVG